MPCIGITFGNNTFAVVGGDAVSDDGNIFRSTDNGSSWDNVTSPTSNGINKVLFGNNNFVAVGTSGNIVRSTDNETTWKNVTSPTIQHFFDVVF